MREWTCHLPTALPVGGDLRPGSADCTLARREHCACGDERPAHVPLAGAAHSGRPGALPVAWHALAGSSLVVVLRLQTGELPGTRRGERWLDAPGSSRTFGRRYTPAMSHRAQSPSWWPSHGPRPALGRAPAAPRGASHGG